MNSNGIIYESADWRLKQRPDCKLPGYLILANKSPEATSFGSIPDEALQELGLIQARAVDFLESKLGARLAYVCRWGHQRGYAPHFHIIPLYPWIVDAYAAHPEYDCDDPDGPMYSQFITIEFIESNEPPTIHGPSIEDVVKMLREEFDGFDEQREDIGES